MTFEALLDSALEHASYAWRDLEVRGIVPEQIDGPWPPVVQSSVGDVDYHLAAMIRYIQQAYDKVAGLAEQIES
jgi:hypothetical protein